MSGELFYESGAKDVICSKRLYEFLGVYLDMPFTFQHNPVWPRVRPSANDTCMTLSATNIFHKGYRPLWLLTQNKHLNHLRFFFLNVIRDLTV